MEHGVFVDILIILSASVVVTAVFHRLFIPTILSYILVGLCIGPFALQMITDTETIQLISEFGVVFLLFTLGLEFSLPKLISLRRSVFGLGGAQVIFTTSLFYFALNQIFKLSPESSFIISAAIALSSTALVSKELTYHNELKKPHGQLAISVLLFQDLAAVFFLIIIPTLASDDNQHIASSLGIMLIKGTALFLAFVGIGKWILPRLFHEIAFTKSDELFVMTTLVITLLAAWFAQSLQLSMALGAFLAGMMLGESHYRHQIESDIRPFRDVLLGLFFVSIGMLVDVNKVIQFWPWILAFGFTIVIGKFFLISLLSILSRYSISNSLRTGMVLAQGGEFGFALLALASSSHLIDPDTNAIVISSIIISMAASPFIIRHNKRILHFIFRPPKTAEKNHNHSSIDIGELDDHVIIFGYGRVGQSISRFLTMESIEFIALDSDPKRVREASTAGENIFYGDVTRMDILKRLGINTARLIIISFDDLKSTKIIITQIRQLRQDVNILVRTRDDHHLEELIEHGATEVIPETLEASLTLAAHSLVMLNIPFSRIVRSMQKIRQQRYQLLHGYYQGEHSLIGAKEIQTTKILHPVALSSGARCIGQPISSIKSNSYCSEIQAIRRNKQSIQSPSDDIILEENDIVILYGNIESIEITEEQLLGGKLYKPVMA